MKNVFYLCLILVLCSNCKGFDEEEQFQDDLIIIENYLADNGITAQKTDSGLHYVITDPGTGSEHPTIANTVRCIYLGYLTDGSVFDLTQPNSPVDFALANVIAGWQEGIPFMKRNGTATFFIPSRLGYGNFAQQGIPKNSVLIFEVGLIHFY